MVGFFSLIIQVFQVKFSFGDVVRIDSHSLIAVFYSFLILSYVSLFFAYLDNWFNFFVMSNKVNNKCMYFCCINSKGLPLKSGGIDIVIKEILVWCQVCEIIFYNDVLQWYAIPSRYFHQLVYEGWCPIFSLILFRCSRWFCSLGDSVWFRHQ